MVILRKQFKMIIFIIFMIIAILPIHSLDFSNIMELKKRREYYNFFTSYKNSIEIKNLGDVIMEEIIKVSFQDLYLDFYINESNDEFYFSFVSLGKYNVNEILDLFESQYNQKYYLYNIINKESCIFKFEDEYRIIQLYTNLEDKFIMGFIKMKY